MYCSHAKHKKQHCLFSTRLQIMSCLHVPTNANHCFGPIQFGQTHQYMESYSTKFSSTVGNYKGIANQFQNLEENKTWYKTNMFFSLFLCFPRLILIFTKMQLLRPLPLRMSENTSDRMPVEGDHSAKVFLLVASQERTGAMWV